MTALGATSQNSDIFSRSSSATGRSLRQTMTSGCTPIESSSRTLCWVGLVLRSPVGVLLACGRRRRWCGGGGGGGAACLIGDRVLVALLVAHLADRFQVRLAL